MLDKQKKGIGISVSPLYFYFMHLGKPDFEVLGGDCNPKTGTSKTHALNVTSYMCPMVKHLSISIKYFEFISLFKTRR